LLYRLALEEKVASILIVMEANWAFRIDIHPTERQFGTVLCVTLQRKCFTLLGTGIFQTTQQNFLPLVATNRAWDSFVTSQLPIIAKHLLRPFVREDPLFIIMTRWCILILPMSGIARMHLASISLNRF
jgi:hypothetical protein